MLAAVSWCWSASAGPRRRKPMAAAGGPAAGKNHSPAVALRLACVALLSTRSEAGTGGLSPGVGHAPCVRLFHASGDVGCRTRGREGVAGPLLLVDSERALQDIEARGLSSFPKDDQREEEGLLPREASAEAMEGMGDGLMAVLPDAFFNRTILHRLSATGLLGGVLVLESGGGGRAAASPAHALAQGNVVRSNPDVKTPQGDSTPSAAFDVDASYPWNSGGDGLLMESFDFPMVLVAGGSSDDVRTRAVSNGNVGGPSWRYPLHKARMAFYFGGSAMDLNSQECLGWTDINGDRSPQCKPLGGQSSWASVGGAGLGGRQTVLAVSGMDSTSMFHDRAPGANSAVSGLVALLSAAESLGTAGRSGSVDFSALPRQIVFATFQAEAYGFTGSRRFVQDWRGEGISCLNRVDPTVSPTGQEACLDPLYPSLEFQKLGKPAHVISVDQVGCLPESTLWVHPSPGASSADTGVVSELSPGGGVVLTNSTRTELPPSPLTAFVKADPEQSGFVLSGYDETFSCPHYHDHADARDTVDAGSVAAAAKVLAKATLALAGGTESSSDALRVNGTLVETLLDCLLEDWSCDTVKEYVVGELANNAERLGFRVSVEAPFPPTLYTGPLEFHYGGGMPTVRHTKGDGSWRLHPSWTEPFDPEHDKIQLVPNLLETFCRAFLSEQAGAAHAGRYGEGECQVSGDCPLEQCQESPSTSADKNHDDDANKSRDGLGGGGRVRPGKGSEERSGNVLRSASSSSSSVTTSSSSAVQRPECVRGRCGCPAGFHHIALDVGLEREEELDQYQVVDGAVGQGAPLWTEPNWRGIGAEVYLDPGVTAGKVALGVGAAVTVAAGVGSWVLLQSLDKRKLL